MPLPAALSTVALALALALPVLWEPDSPVLVTDSSVRDALVAEWRGRLGENARRER